ncbi:MAG: ABC transporter substrate-binding protein [Candidatus Competibacterales bacterium]
MKTPLPIAAAGLLLHTLGAPAVAATPQCEIDRPIVFAGLDWASNAFHTATAQFILQHGYGCQVDEIPGSTIPMLNGLARGDVDVYMEFWAGNVTESWIEAEEAGLVKSVGTNFPDAIQGWFVPNYLIEGEDAPAPDLRSVFDLPRYKELFRDPEEPSKGRFYNCIAGWTCEEVNSRKLVAYDLAEHYTNFRPGTGAALAAAIESNIKRRRPILFYYWGPTRVLGKVGDQVTMLEEPPFDPETWQKMNDTPTPEEAVAYPVLETVVGVNTEFAQQAPTVVEFLSAYETSNALISGVLAYMQDTGKSAEEAARHFLETREDIWTTWVDDAVAERVKAAL